LLLHHVNFIPARFHFFLRLFGKLNVSKVDTEPVADRLSCKNSCQAEGAFKGCHRPVHGGVGVLIVEGVGDGCGEVEYTSEYVEVIAVPVNRDRVDRPLKAHHKNWNDVVEH